MLLSHDTGAVHRAAPAEQFERSATALLASADAHLAAALAGHDAIRAGAMAALHDTVLRKISRTLVLELNAARLTGGLTAPDSAGRWAEFVDRTCEPDYWDSLAPRYPTLLPRLRTVITNRVEAAIELAHRFTHDRDELGIGELTATEFGAGDSHQYGRTVVLLHGTAGSVVYKPRSVAVDHALANLLDAVVPDAIHPIRVPAVHVKDGYGWAEHVAHRHCTTDAELTAFYRNLGHWLAIMRLLGGTDLHQENLIAAGPVPVVVDCETLFTPRQPARPSGYGSATDAAHAMVAGSVLGTGLLPGRGLVLNWRGIDTSAIGSLPDQQPAPDVPVIVDAGSDTAHVGFAKAPPELFANHPCAEPVLGKYWQHVVSGFTHQTVLLEDLDSTGQLADLLAPFADLPVRAVVRTTETYAELSRMLWHPASLHDERAAVAKAANLLAQHAANSPDAPDDPEVIAAEVAELLAGDIPYFTTTPATGVLTGPRGTRWGRAVNVIAEELTRWRTTDPDVDRRVIQAALVSAYLNEGWLPEDIRRLPSTVDEKDLDRRRRALARRIVEQIAATAIRGDDGTASWVAPVLNPTGWSVQALSPDLYSGIAGVAVVLAGYLREQHAGRVDDVPGLGVLLDGALQTMRLAEDRWTADLAAGVPLRPEPAGGYIGLGSRMTGWLLLRRLGFVGDEAVTRACWLAQQLPRAIVEDTAYDVLIGRAGAIVPLLRLAELTGEQAFLAHASVIGDQLVAAAAPRGETVCWPNAEFPEGIGGFAHGATGIGWALARLAEVTGDAAHANTAQAAFAYEQDLYSPELGGWLDLREQNRVAGAWCHGAVGIGVAATDLARFDSSWREVAARAAESAWTHGTGWNHTLCHGDLGVWELNPGQSSHMVVVLEEYGVVTGLAREAFSPALLPGAGGIAYQLLRLHPESDLPSVLLPDPGPA